MRKGVRGTEASSARFRVTPAALTLPGKYDNACGDDKTNGFHYSCARTIVVNLLIGRCLVVKRIFRRIRAFSRRIRRLVVFHRPASVFLSVDWAFALLGTVIILHRVWPCVRSWSLHTLLLDFTSQRSK